MDDAKISKKFARKNEHNGLINNSSKWSNSKLYAPDDVAYMREHVLGNKTTEQPLVQSNWRSFNDQLDGGNQ